MPVANATLGIDTGGTFTDFVLVVDGQVSVHKLLSTPDDPARAAVDGATAMALPARATVTHGTTVATNALLERKGARTALVTTAGFEDVIQIGRQARSRLYDLEYQPPEPLVPRDLRFGVDERIAAEGSIVVALSPNAVDALAARISAAGVDSVAISLLFSFLHPAHEAALRDAIAARDPSLYVTASSDLLPEFREFERTSTTVINAYVGPLLSGYLDRLRAIVGRPLRIMQSSGGGITVDLACREPVRAVLSGPAGGVIGAFYVAVLAGHNHIVTFDMGGTSTDVALCPTTPSMACPSACRSSTSRPLARVAGPSPGSTPAARCALGRNPRAPIPARPATGGVKNPRSPTRICCWDACCRTASWMVG